MKKFLSLLLLTMSIVYGKLPSFSGTEVKMPWDELRSIIEDYMLASQKPARSYIFTEAKYSAELDNNILKIEGNLKLNVLDDNWQKVELLPIKENASGITSIYLNGKKANLLVEDQTYYLLLKGKGSYNLKLSIFYNLSSQNGETIYLPFSSISFFAIDLDKNTLFSISPVLNTETEIKGNKRSITYTLSPSKIYSVSITKFTVTEKTSEVNTLFIIDREKITARVGLKVPINYVKNEISVVLPENAIIKGNFKTSLEDGKLRVFIPVNVREQPFIDCLFSYEVPVKTERTKLPLPSVENTPQQKGYFAIITGDVEVRKEPSHASVKSISPSLLTSSIFYPHKNRIFLAFSYTGIPEEYIIIKRHKKVEPIEKSIDSEHLTTLVTEKGFVVTKVLYTLRLNRSTYFKIRLPQNSSIWSCKVNDNPISPMQDEEGNIIVNVWGDARNLVDVELIYIENNQNLANRKRFKLVSPEVHLPVSEAYWSIWTPPGYSLKLKKTNMKPIKKKEIKQIEKEVQAYGGTMNENLLTQKSYPRTRLNIAKQIIEERKFSGYGEEERGVIFRIPEGEKVIRLKKLLIIDENLEVVLSLR